MKALLVFNPESGPFRPDRRLKIIKDTADAHNVELTVMETRPDKSLKDLFKSVDLSQYDRIWVSGGDGTINAMAQIAADNDKPMAVIPGGTVNSLALAFNIPLVVNWAVKLACAGKEKRIDLVELNEHPLLLIGGAGWDAMVLNAVGREEKKRFGFIAYLVGIFRYLRPGKETWFNIATGDGVEITKKGQGVYVINNPRQLKVVRVLHNSEPDDGMAEILIVSSPSITASLLFGLRLLFGKTERDRDVSVIKVKKAVINMESSRLYQIDGDGIGITDKMEVVVREKAVRLIVPTKPPVLTA
ncbi:hypothetical protein ISS30_09465 [bacterium]|nr:hypothetical protein [bacterium]